LSFQLFKTLLTTIDSYTITTTQKMEKKILIILGHPVKETFSNKLTQAYIEAAESSGAEIRYLKLNQLKFDPNFSSGYRGNQELEPDLVMAQKMIQWAEHLVFFYPNWWSTFPALLKGFIDRTFLPGFAFKYKKGVKRHEKLLTGKSARLIVTMDNLPWYYRWVLRQPCHHAMKKGILQFCGVNPVRITTIGPVKISSEKRRNKWLKQISSLGEAMI
jgi:NAD(P)H dehydrogenase (quinone)